jgi:hypothetical protein
MDQGGRCGCHGSKGDVRVDTSELAADLARGQIQCQQRLQILLQIVAVDCAAAKMARPEINIRRSSRRGCALLNRMCLATLSVVSFYRDVVAFDHRMPSCNADVITATESESAE